LWQRCHGEPGLVLDERERFWLGDVAGKRVAVLGSGDNLIAFALAGMGARVTSVDISAKQLAVARERAGQVGLAMEFVRADVCGLAELAAGSFDLVFTGGHIAIWVADLPKFYAEAVRILKPGGKLLISEYHPFCRLWKENTERLELAADYFHRGPYTYNCPAGPQHEFQWTVSDYINNGRVFIMMPMHTDSGQFMPQARAAPVQPTNLPAVAARITMAHQSQSVGEFCEPRLVRRPVNVKKTGKKNTVTNGTTCPATRRQTSRGRAAARPA